MTDPRHERPAPTRDRRDIGRVVILSEKMETARTLSGCCTGVETLLEIDTTGKGLLARVMERLGRR